ncbi:unnamed protein product [Peronospora belbahrii]|uniref:FYVE-type domain-containing protein n=1 Tax=Peronospora belbahrii TaxID=622444 RepID=A0AAU9L3Y8_9STRA|nr:unnamed protein product [Peronospora belbahrii]CAH0522013.1 unnamed protein product [Peronospora belbahrii]
MEVPLETKFFPQSQLTADEQRRYVTIGEQSATALYHSMKTLDWKQMMEKDGVTYAQAYYINDDRSSLTFSSSATTTTSTSHDEPEMNMSACFVVSATAFAAGTISEVLEALASPITEDYRRVMQFMHGSCFIDGTCLHTIAKAKPNNCFNTTKHKSQSFTTVKWAAFDDGKAFNTAEFPAGTDYCFLEHSGIHRGDGVTSGATNGSDTDLFGFSIQESIAREHEVPSLAGIGPARGHFHQAGILVLPTDRSNVVQITSILQKRMPEGTVGDGSETPSSFGKVGVLALAQQMRQRVSAVGKLYLLLERRRLSKLEHVSRSDWVPDNARKACAVCVKPFALRRRKHHCRHCGEVVCSSCAPAREVDLDAANSPSSTNVRICTACVVQSRTEVQSHSNRDVFVYCLRDTGSMSLSRSSRYSAGSLTVVDNNNAELDTRPISMSSESSTFSISIGSQVFTQLTCFGYKDGSSSLYDDENNYIDTLPRRSSIYSLTQLDAFDSLSSSPLSNQDEIDCESVRYRRSSEGGDHSWSHAGSTLPICLNNLRNLESTSNLLERIQGIKADLFTMTSSYRHFSDASNFSIGSSSVSSFMDKQDVTRWSDDVGNLEPKGFVHEESRQRTGSSNYQIIHEARDNEWINNSDQFTLLRPDTLSRQWCTRISSQIQQDTNENARLSTSLSNMSFVSTLSNLTMLDDEKEIEQRKSREIYETIEASDSQVALQTLQQQVEEMPSTTTVTPSILLRLFDWIN